MPYLLYATVGRISTPQIAWFSILSTKILDGCDPKLLRLLGRLLIRTKGSPVHSCSVSSAISRPTVTDGIGPWCMTSWGWSKTRTSIRGEKRVQIGISFVVGGLIPAIPVFLSLPQAEWWAYGLTALTALVLGAVKARYTRQRPVWAVSNFLSSSRLRTVAGVGLGLLLHGG